METKPPDLRWRSVDALRGFDMFWIVGGRELVTALAAESFDNAHRPALVCQLMTASGARR